MTSNDGFAEAKQSDDSEETLAGVAKSGVISLVGSLTSAIMGFALVVVLGRTLGEIQSGIVLQAIAIFSIAMAVTRMGLDTTGVWLLPRLTASQPWQVRSAVGNLMLPAVICGLLGTLILWFCAPVLATGRDGADGLVQAIRTISWFLAAGALMTVALQVTRGLGNIIPYALIGNIAVPTLRPILAFIVVLLGGTAVGVSLSWALPLAIGALLAVWVVFRRVQNVERKAAETSRRDFSRVELRKKIWRFSAPRWYASILEQSITWFDVVIVGFIAGAGAAGIYGAASRFVTAGLIISTAMRVVVSPRFSRLLEENRRNDVQTLYTAATTWIVLFSTPMFVVFIFFAPTILGWIGEGFEDGAQVLIVLSLATMISMLFGNADSLLMMSGRSAVLAINKTLVLAINIIGNVLLIPKFGILAAAVVWAASMILNAALAATQNSILLKISWGGGKVLYALIVSLVCSIIPCLVLIQLMGQGTGTLIFSVLILLTFLAIWCFMDRKRLGLRDLVSMRKSKR